MIFNKIILPVIFIFLSANHFEIVSSKKETYRSGRREGGKGANYYISIVSNKSSKHLTFDKLIVQGKSLKVSIESVNGHENKRAFQKKDAVILQSSVFVKDEEFNSGEETIILEYTY
ncbi:MAG: hypothetical protein MI922_25520, partial [Bacteroidales bacterium]|nr:hypothetical protein [Bacteroidales bacterium]